LTLLIENVTPHQGVQSLIELEVVLE